MNKGYTYTEALTDRELDILRLKVNRETNQEIANALHLARNTVRWYVSQIYSKLHVTNRTELKQRVQELGLLDEQTPTTLTIQQTLPNPITSFIGREHEVTEISQRLATARLITLSGIGGTGKTRLALEVIDKIQTNYRDGAQFVNLAPLSDPSTVTNAIAEVLGVIKNRDESLEDTLKRVLQNRNSLLVLDNFEHVLSAAPLVSELLQASTELSVLVTSRQVLHLYGEQEYSVPPLTLPDSNLPQSLDTLVQNEAIQLFVQRAKAVSRNFSLNEDNVATIAQICRRLDGLPLAIELAVAHCKILTPDALLSRLGTRLDTLTSGARDVPKRQQTIRNTIEWSYDLLDDYEKILFERLSVFRGGRSLEACETVCAEGLPIDVFEGLASLIDKNLLVSREDSLGEPRFWMLETIQEYALERLDITDEAELIHKRHATYFTQLAETTKPKLREENQAYWFQRMDVEHDNMRTALRWALGGNAPELGVRLVIALIDFWYYSVHQIEADRWTHLALEHIEDVAPEYRGRLFLVASDIYWFARPNHIKSREFAERGYAIGCDLNDTYLMARGLRDIAGSVIVSTTGFDDILAYEEVLNYVNQSLELWRELADLPQLAQTLNVVALLQEMNGDYIAARKSYEECIAVAVQCGDIRRQQINLSNLAFMARDMGQHERATTLAKKSLRLGREINTRLMMATTLIRTADPATEPERVTRLLAASESAIKRLGTLFNPTSQKPFHDSITIASEKLSEENFAVAWEEGSAMSLDEAVAYALDEIDRPNSQNN